MKRVRSSPRSIIRINGLLLLAFGCGYIAWAIWPQSVEWWGLGFISILLGIGAATLVVSAVTEAGALHRKESEISGYLARGGAPKPSRMATTGDLKRAGMLDE
jgi:hypothetical protein